MKENNICLFAENCENTGGFNVYLDFSGQKEYLMWHRHNGVLYEIMKDGVNLNYIRRNKPHKICMAHGFEYYGNNSSKLENTINHLLAVVNEYLEEKDWEIVV